jgi:hypothetical protein
MSSEETNKKHWLAHAPSILTGSAALIAALTTVYINVRSNKSAPAAAAQVLPAVSSSNATMTLSSPAPALTPASRREIDLRLDRVRVDNDGTMGTTDWTFDIKNGERSLFSVPFKALTDKAGDNIVAPKEASLAHARLVLAAGDMPDITVRGWKQAWSGKAHSPDVLGQGKLNVDDGSLVIEARSEETGGPAFVLYFNTHSSKK